VTSFSSHAVLGMRVDNVESADAVRIVLDWSESVQTFSTAAGRGRYVCAANVHMVMEAHDHDDFRHDVNASDLVVPDGQPMVWALRLERVPQQRRVRVSPDWLLQLFAGAQARSLRIGLYGGDPQTLRAFSERLKRHFPALEVAYAWDPPFRTLTAEEEQGQARRIREARVQLLLVGLGCPKQERWMARQVDTLPCVMVGVGAAFDMLGGRTRNAPAWMRDRGLEWVFRLLSEPRRLWRRHVVNDPRFLALLLKQSLLGRFARRSVAGTR